MFANIEHYELKNIKPGFTYKTNIIPSTENATWSSCIGWTSSLPFSSSSPSKSRTDSSKREMKGKKLWKFNFFSHTYNKALSREVRQGDPLSPLQFILDMEELSWMLKRTEVGVQQLGSLSPIFQLQVIQFYCDADTEHILCFWRMLTCFKVVTSLKVNMDKSEMVPIGNVGNMEVLTNIRCCKVGSLPMTYLGMSLKASFKAIFVWNPILEKVECQLSLLKSTLSSLPTYYLSLFTIPTCMVNRLEILYRNVL